MLSAAKNRSWHREILRPAQHDSQHGAMKLDRVLQEGDSLWQPKLNNHHW